MTSPARILLVEHNPDDVARITAELERASLCSAARVVTRAADFESALREFAPDVVLCDFFLPGLNAFRVIEVVASHYPVPPPILVVTDTLDEETAAATIKAGAADYVLKAHLPRLAPAVRAALDLRRAREARARAESALRHSEEAYRSLVDGVRDVIFALRPDGIITALNPAFEAVTGHPREDWLGRSFVELVHPADRTLAGSLFARVLLGEHQPSCAFRIRAANGTFRIGEFSAGPQMRDGRVAAVLGIARDVTDRRRTEQQLQQAQTLDALGRLAGGVAGDLEALVAELTDASGRLQAALGAQHPGRTDVERIARAAGSAARLTERLAAVRTRRSPERQLVDVNAVVADMDVPLRRAVAAGVTLRTVLAPGLGRVRADAWELEQVITHLVANANDAMPEGGVLTIQTADVDLGTTLASERPTVEPGRYVLLAISDTGTGMDAPTQARIFEPFFTTKHGGGAGLGLSTVDTIVQASGGHIWVYSELGHGTTVKVYLPREVAPAPAAAPAETSGGSETVLLVEDRDDMRRIFRRSLESRGYAVVDAANAEAALTAADLHAGPIELLITDLVLPGMAGTALSRKLRERRPYIRTLLMSGYNDVTLGDRFELEPGAVLLEKPFTAEQLARTARDVLDAPVDAAPAAPPRVGSAHRL